MEGNPQELEDGPDLKDQTSPVQTTTTQTHPVQNTPAPSELIQKPPAPSELIQNTPAPSELVQNTPAPSEPVQNTPAPSELVQNTPAPSEPVQNTPAPSELIQKPPAPSELVQNTPAPSEPVQNTPAPSEPVQNTPAPSELIQKPPAPSELIQKPPAPSELIQKPPAPSELIQNTTAPSEPVQNTPAPSEPVQNTPAPSEPVQNTPAPSEPVQNTPAPSELVQNTPAPSELVQNTPAPSEPVQNTPAPSELIQKTPAPSELVQNTTAPSELVQNTPAPSELVQNTPAPSKLVQNTPAPSELVQNTPAPSELIQKPPAPSELIQNTTAPSELVQNTPAPSEPVQNTPAPSELVQNTPAPSEPVQNTPAPSEMVQNTTASSELIQNTTASSELIQNTTASSELIQNTTAPSELVQNNPAPSDLVQNTTAQTGGNVITPVLHGNVFNGPVNINTAAEPQHKGGAGKGQVMSGSPAASSTTLSADQQPCIKLKSTLKLNYERLLIGSSLTGHQKFLEDIYTDLVIVQNKSGGVIKEHEVMKIEMSPNKPGSEEECIKCRDIFKVHPGTDRRNRKVMTMGIAGVGKTVSVNKFILDWAKGKENQDIQYIFPLPFRELNLKKDKEFSLIELLNNSFFSSKPELKSLPEEDGKVLFIFDGLDEYRYPLQFEDGEEVNDVNEKSSVGSLITNLINKKLLSFSLIWVTCRPAAAHLIPQQYIDLATEVQGFNDEHKEAYFTKYCKPEAVAEKIISHIKKLKSLHIMCQIPVFCWISATVLQPLMDKESDENIPKTLTEMYISFLLQQKNLMKEKYSKKTGTNTQLIILKLGKLAFSNLESGELNFYEDNLKKCGIVVRDGTVFSGVCTQIFSQQKGFSERNIFSFVHLSVQESLAAVYVYHSHCNKRKNVFKKTFWNKLPWKNNTVTDLHKSAVDRALQSENGHLDLFLRFLLGLSVKDSKEVLNELLPSLKIKVESVSNTANYIKEKLKEELQSDRSLNLLHCLRELKDNSLIAEIQNLLNSGTLSTQELSSTQWSALIFVLMMSENTQDKFELKKYRASEEGLRRLLPVVKNTKRALLDHCSLSKNICETLASELITGSALIELDLSNNDLQDSGVELLSAGLKSSHCKLQILRLSGCMITEKGCSSLASALSSNPSHLKELDLTYNHPGESGERLLSARLEDPHCALETLRMEHGGKIRIKPGLKKYGCDLTLDPNTVNRYLSLSEENRTVECGVELQSFPDHPERFDEYHQVLSRESVTGRCYWEAEWRSGWGGGADVALSYKTISRKGVRLDCRFGGNINSWSLSCSDNRYSVHHNNNRTDLPLHSSGCRRVGVYVDCLAGTLSFYRVSTDTHSPPPSPPHTPSHLHTFYTTFTQPLYAGLWVGIGSSVTLCKIE